MTRPDEGARRVIFVGNVLPHYRDGVHSALDSADEFDFEFAADSGEVDGIRGMDHAKLRVFHPLSNKRLGRATWQVGVLRLLARRRYAAVIFTGDASFLSTWVAAALLRLRRVPVLYWTMGWRSPDRGARRHIRLAFYRLANGLLLYGDRGRQVGIASGYPESRMHVIYNAVGPVAEERAVDLSEAIARSYEGAWEVGAVTRLTPEKRFDLLVEAAAELGNRGRPIRVALVGDGPQAPTLRRLADDLNVSLDILPPTYRADQLSEFYSRISTCVLPAAAGLAVIQSLEHGVPVITDDNPFTANPESEAIVADVTGDRYETGSAARLADVIEVWLDRVDRDGSNVSESCVAEARSRWTPENQARRILEAVRSYTRPDERDG